jgi:hypothetical protein
MFTSSLTEEVRSLNTYVEHVSAKIDSPVLCEKVRQFVYAPRDIQETYRVDARLEHAHLLRAILMGGEALSTSLAGRVNRAWSKWAAWMAERKREGRGKPDESDSEEGPVDEEAWLFEDLRVLLQLYSRLRDREQLIALIFEARFYAHASLVVHSSDTIGRHGGVAQGHHHHLLHAARASV